MKILYLLELLKEGKSQDSILTTSHKNLPRPSCGRPNTLFIPPWSLTCCIYNSLFISNCPIGLRGGWRQGISFCSFLYSQSQDHSWWLVNKWAIELQFDRNHFEEDSPSSLHSRCSFLQPRTPPAHWLVESSDSRARKSRLGS